MCERCNNPLDEEPSQSKTSLGKSDKNIKIEYCSNCGLLLKRGDVTCPQCGILFEVVDDPITTDKERAQKAKKNYFEGDFAWKAPKIQLK